MLKPLMLILLLAANSTVIEIFDSCRAGGARKSIGGTTCFAHAMRSWMPRLNLAEDRPKAKHFYTGKKGDVEIK